MVNRLTVNVRLNLGDVTEVFDWCSNIDVAFVNLSDKTSSKHHDYVSFVTLIN